MQHRWAFRYRLALHSLVSFGNARKDLMKTYTTNVTTNLDTHREKRLVNYFKLKVFESNTASPVIYRYVPNDIPSVVDLLIHKKDIEGNSNADQVKHLRRDMLIQMIQNISWFDIFKIKLFVCKQANWFKAMPVDNNATRNRRIQHQTHSGTRIKWLSTESGATKEETLSMAPWKTNAWQRKRFARNQEFVRHSDMWFQTNALHHRQLHAV